MKLPFVVSVPHAGLRVPPEAAPYCKLTEEEIAADGDVQAAEVYDISGFVAGYATSDIARAIVDLNRAENDRRKDGVVKTHTCWDVPVYDPTPPEDVFERLIERYHRPFHRRLTELAGAADFVLALDCHTMAAEGPPVGPDPGKTRPWVCLSHADGTCPDAWIEALRDAFQMVLNGPVTINDPFQGGYIIRTHAAEAPWIQIELSRGDFATAARKRERLIQALTLWTETAMEEGWLE